LREIWDSVTKSKTVEINASFDELWAYMVSQRSGLLKIASDGIYSDIPTNDDSLGWFYKQAENQFGNVKIFQEFLGCKKINETWSPQKYNQAMIGIEDLTRTPFMLEIIIKSLPKLKDSTISETRVKKLFLDKLKGSEFSDLEWKKIEDLIRNYDVYEEKLFEKGDTSNVVNVFMANSDDIPNFLAGLLCAIETKLIERGEQRCRMIIGALQKSLRTKGIIRYELYEVFINEMFEREVEKVKNAAHGGIIATREDLIEDFKTFSHNLSMQMTNSGLNRVNYQVSGVKFRENNIWDQFFKPTEKHIDKIVRDGIPIVNTGGIWRFKHKSYQEFFVADNIYRSIMKFDLLLNPKVIQKLF
jgi:hypothetical protein